MNADVPKVVGLWMPVGTTAMGHQRGHLEKAQQMYTKSMSIILLF